MDVCVNWNRIFLNPLTPNDIYSGRIAPLTSKRCILYIYSTNIGTEYTYIYIGRTAPLTSKVAFNICIQQI